MRILSCILLIISFGVFYAGAQVGNELVPLKETYYSKHKFLHPEFCMLQFYSRDALDAFYKKWKNTNSDKLSILHFGDSHCQHEAFPGQVRKRLQELHGAGGRGLMFPYSAANTYTSVEYFTTHTGAWSYEKGFTMLPRLPLGVRGMTCRTVQAPVTLGFSFTSDVPNHYTILKLFCKQTLNSYDLSIEIDGKYTPVIIDDKNPDPYITVKIPAIGNRKMTLHVVKNNPDETEFEFYGMSLESEQEKGILYHNCGVGAARFGSLLFYELLWKQIPYVQPDLIVLDYGTNDYLYDDIIRPDLEKEIKTIIAKMRAAAPDACIILTSSQDLYFKNRNCRSGIPFSDMIHRIAGETKCAVFDWFYIAGGQGTMHDWVKQGLAQPDYIHLSVPGYQLKGDLLFESVRNTMSWFDKYSEREEFFFNVDSLKKIQPPPPPVVVKTQQNPVKQNPSNAAVTKVAVKTPAKTVSVPNASTAGRVKYVHKITSGESLYSIAKKYNVTISQLKSWNNLHSDLINAGKTLNIWVIRR